MIMYGERGSRREITDLPADMAKIDEGKVNGDDIVKRKKLRQKENIQKRGSREPPQRTHINWST